MTCFAQCSVTITVGCDMSSVPSALLLYLHDLDPVTQVRGHSQVRVALFRPSPSSVTSSSQLTLLVHCCVQRC